MNNYHNDIINFVHVLGKNDFEKKHFHGTREILLKEIDVISIFFIYMLNSVHWMSVFQLFRFLPWFDWTFPSALDRIGLHFKSDEQ